MTPAQIAQLKAVQANAVALAMSIEEFLGAEEDPDAPCKHPEEMREPRGVMGNPNRFRCRLCNQICTEV